MTTPAKKGKSSEKHQAAMKGNEWWRLAEFPGRPKIFASAEELLERCYEYLEKTDSRKWIKQEVVRGGPLAGETVELEMATPYTRSGLCLHLGIDPKTWYNYGNNEEQYKEFFPIVTRVNAIIDTQQIEGASVGAFNPTLIAMLQRLKNLHEFELTKDSQVVRELFKGVEAAADEE